MKKLFFTFLFGLAVVLIIPVPGVLAWQHEKPVTPYGDFCKLCGEYGSCRRTMSHEDAKRALINYYHKKGFGVELDRKHGRFIRAKIRGKKGVVDVIIFDRRTGRVRSIY